MDFTLNKTIPAGCNKFEHYAGIAETIHNIATEEKVKEITVAADVLVLFRFSPMFKREPMTIIEGPFTAGYLSEVKVIASPFVKPGEVVIGNKTGIVK